MIDFDRVRAVWEAEEPRLMMLPGVHAVGMGAKLVAGKRSGSPAVVVLVARKKPLGELDSSEVIPPEIDGVKTDVIQCAPPRSFQLIGDNEDTTTYRPLVGGSRIEPGERNGLGGTLGCIVEPADGNQSSIFGLTCFHVVGIGVGAPTNLVVDINPKGTPQTGPVTFTFSTRNHRGDGIVETPGTIVIGNFIASNQAFDVIIDSKRGDTVDDLAKKLVARINALGVITVAAPVDATDSDGGKVAKVTIAKPAGTSLAQCAVYGAQTLLSASLTPRISGNKITFSGSVSGKFYGIYTEIFFGSNPRRATQGVFVHLADKATSSDAANALASELTAAGVTASPSGATVTIDNADVVECVVWPDVRVGQQNNGFSSWCDHEIGRVFRGRYDLEAVLIQLNLDLKYLAQIQEQGAPGFVTGSLNVNPSDVAGTTPFLVELRGMATQLNTGAVKEVQGSHGDLVAFVNGFTAEKIPEEPGSYFPRRYLGAMVIQPDTAKPFGHAGDSGAVVVQKGTGKVVGLLFGGDSDLGLGFATPIGPILSAFDVKVSTATSLNDVRTVTKQEGVSAQDAREENALPLIPSRTQVRIRQARALAASMPSAEEYVQMVRRHAAEAGRLVNKNRRVGAAWQRNGGPLLFKAFIKALEEPRGSLPSEVAGRPLDQCLLDIGAAFRASASADFVSDLDRVLPIVMGLGGKTYADLLARLEPAGATDRADTSISSSESVGSSP